MDLLDRPQPERPLGYWLTHLHNLLETHFAATLDDLGLSRRHWQVLNTFSRADRTTHDDLTTALAPFWTNGEPELDGLLDEFAARGWTRRDALPGLTLTDAGRAVHAEAAARIASARTTVMTGLTPEQYTEVIRILSVMADNVAADLAARAPEGA
ncbi:MarR family winged helix-turn-helix transcriptional regulator [Streptomyces sp. NPDC059649]|uniref:MarR family winged helix-turn-helix transcriptional regulator n=1 Tax=Streptomyces sp. NPDC059649 TaxID=3346895 RepID=UPI00368DA2D9